VGAVEEDHRERPNRSEFVMITYGTNPPCLVLKFPGFGREPYVIYTYSEAVALANEICEAIPKAWKGRDHLEKV